MTAQILTAEGPFTFHPAEGKEINFRQLGRILASTPWMPNILQNGYSYADHLVNLAAMMPAKLQLDALLSLAPYALDAPVTPIVKREQGRKVFSFRFRQACGQDIIIPSAMANLRTAAELPAHQSDINKQMIAQATAALIKAEIKAMTTSQPCEIFKGAAQPKKPPQPRPKEAIAAIWAEQVEKRIPSKLARMNADKLAG